MRKVKIFWIAIVIIILSYGIGDLFTTLLAFNRWGAWLNGDPIETSLIGHWVFINWGAPGLIIAKWIGLTIITLLIYAYNKLGFPLTAINIALGAAILGIIVTINNYFLITLPKAIKEVVTIEVDGAGAAIVGIFIILAFTSMFLEKFFVPKYLPRIST